MLKNIPNEDEKQSKWRTSWIPRKCLNENKSAPNDELPAWEYITLEMMADQIQSEWNWQSKWYVTEMIYALRFFYFAGSWGFIKFIKFCFSLSDHFVQWLSCDVWTKLIILYSLYKKLKQWKSKYTVALP